MDNYQTTLDHAFHALADTTRRAVIQRLGKGATSVSELASSFDMALPSFMKHITVLENAGLIASEKIGRVRTCTLNPKKLATLEVWLEEQQGIWKARHENLDELLTKLKGEPK